jgi:hypothetical protein
VSRGTRGTRTVVGVTIATLVIPVGLSILFMPSHGAIWQGRYELVYCMGILPLCGLLMDRHRFAPVEGRRLTAYALVFLAVAHVLGVVYVMHLELQRPESTLHSGWVHPPTAVTGALALAGFAVLSGLVLKLRRDDA